MEGLPVKLWGLDPLYWTHVKLFARDVLQLAQYPGFKGVFALSNHPIVKALVTGYVVKVERKEKLTIYGVDDGTASIPCCHWVDQGEITEDSQQADLGDLVTVLGKITTFREQRQITIATICIENDPNAEVLHWLEVLKNKEIYNKPFEVPTQLNPKVKDIVVKKPWLKNPLDIEIDNLEQALKTDISNFLESKSLQSCSIDNLCDVSQLKEKVTVLSHKYEERSCKKTEIKLSKELSSETVSNIIRPMVRLLEKDGIIYRKNSFGGFFEVITKKDLCPQILRVIQDISDKEGESSFGISANKIMVNLKSLERYQYIRRNKLTQALAILVESGDIYETKEHHYRRVCI